MGIENFVITQETTTSGIKFTIQGRLDSTNAVELDQKLQSIKYNEHTSIVLNMLRVEYLCSTGIRIILKNYKAIKAAGGTFGIEHPSEWVRNVLGLVALNEMLIE